MPMKPNPTVFTDASYTPDIIKRGTPFTDNISPADIEELKRKVQELRLMGDDWNGYGATGAKEAAITNAVKFIGLMWGVNAANTAYLDDGDVVLLWDHEPTKSTLVAIDENTFHYYVRDAEKPDLTKSDLEITQGNVLEVCRLLPKRSSTL